MLFNAPLTWHMRMVGDKQVKTRRTRKLPHRSLFYFGVGAIVPHAVRAQKRAVRQPLRLTLAVVKIGGKVLSLHGSHYGYQFISGI